MCFRVIVVGVSLLSLCICLHVLLHISTSRINEFAYSCLLDAIILLCDSPVKVIFHHRKYIMLHCHIIRSENHYGVVPLLG